MKISALRSVSKINRNVIQNSRRLFSFKFEMTPASRVATDQTEESKSPPSEEPQKSPGNFRYNVCQPRTTSIERPMACDISSIQKQTVKAAIEDQHLQPAMLPEYYQKQMEKNVLINPEPDPSEEERINKGHISTQRKFQVSKTYANAILPLKNVKLANPFPEPVKMMMSRTVSDDEKAEQMLAESRNQQSGKSSTFRSFSTDVKRWYSKTVGPDPDKCKKGPKRKDKVGCPKLKLKGCPDRVRLQCTRKAKHIDCKKQPCPYPAYSEFCHEDPDEKPSSCKICPWKLEENPNFKPQKPQKKDFHTSASAMLRRSGLEMETNELEAEEEVTPVALEDEILPGMQCDLRKPPCERPKNRRCPPTKEQKRKEEEKKRKKEKEKKDCAELLVEDVSTQNLLFLRSHKEEDKGHGPCKIRKFPFAPCVEEKRRESIADSGKCPKKKKRPSIRDCPGTGDDSKKCKRNIEEVIEEYSMRDSKRDKTKCPRIDMTTFKEEDADDDPCKTKRRGTTRICPGDLLKKKKRIRKPPPQKTSGVLTPAEPKTEQPQPSRTI